jgi:hypothetical protein
MARADSDFGPEAGAVSADVRSDGGNDGGEERREIQDSVMIDDRIDGIDVIDGI